MWTLFGSSGRVSHAIRNIRAVDGLDMVQGGNSRHPCAMRKNSPIRKDDMQIELREKR